MAEVIIIGAGLTGLSAAYHLEKNNFNNFKIFEKESYPGGLLKSFSQDGFTFDFTGHLLHIKDNYFLNFLNDIADINNFNITSRNSSIYINDKLTPYPFQTNLANLDENIIFDAIYGFIKRKNKIKSPRSFYQWVLKYFGQGIGKHFFFPYNKKLFAYDIKKITPTWTGHFVPQTSLKAMLHSALNKKITTNLGYNSKFYYPIKGGIEFLIKKLNEKIKNKIYTNYTVTQIDIKNKIIFFQNGHKEKYKKLISTIPLNNLIEQLKTPANLNFNRIKNELLCNSVINFNIGFNVENISKKHWIYYPEKKYPFYRIGFWNNICKNSVPAKHSAIYGEISYLKNKSQKQIQNILKKSIEQTLKILNLKKSNIVTKKILHIPNAYVIYNFWREKNLQKLHQKLNNLDLYSIGRYGEWKYSSMEEAIFDGKKIAEKILDKLNINKIYLIKSIVTFNKEYKQQNF